MLNRTKHLILRAWIICIIVCRPFDKVSSQVNEQSINSLNAIVTLHQLLLEMPDLMRFTNRPSYYYRLKQSSSYDRRSITPFTETGIFY